MACLDENNIEIPKFFRVLIVDDEVSREFNNVEYRDFFISYFTLIASNQNINNVHVRFEQDPEKSIELWANEFFDLTLIDADFSNTSLMESMRGSDSQRFAFNATRQGFTVLRQFHDWVKPKKGRFHYRKGGCEFFLWSGLPENDLNDRFGEFNLPSTIYCHPKGEEIGDKINQILYRIINVDELSGAQKLERIITAEREGLLSSKKSNYNKIAKIEDEKIVISNYSLNSLKPEDRFVPFVGRVISNEKQNQIALSDIICSMNLEEIPSKQNDPLFELKEQFIKRQNTQNAPSFYFSKPKLDKLTPDEEKNKPFPECQIKNRYIAAATPLTGISVVGEEHAKSALLQKVIQMLNGPFGAVVLKTVYLDKEDQWDNCHWPGIQAQSHMRTRCLYPDTGTATLWNTGRTAMEMLSPRGLASFLKLAKSEINDQHERVIVSLGSKYYPKGEIQRGYKKGARENLYYIWNKLFSTVFDFDKNSDSAFPFVEINVRHYLREVIEHCMGGDEYLMPSSLNEDTLHNEQIFWEEYKLWLEVVHEVGVEYKKQLILKFPYRSDTLGLIKCALSLRKWHTNLNSDENKNYGIRGFTLVNALKTPVPQGRPGKPYLPEWYAHPLSWGDANNKLYKYQMSGSHIASYRNQLFAGFLPDNIIELLKELGMYLFLSGGITESKEIEYVHSQLKDKELNYGIEIGTWGLLNGNLGIADWGKGARECAKPSKVKQILQLDLSRCQDTCCNENKISYCPEGNIVKVAKGKFDIVKEYICHNCSKRVCIEKCKYNNLKLCQPKEIITVTDKTHNRTHEHPNTIAPRFCFANTRICIACGNCINTFYCDSFYDRSNDMLPPLHDPRNCTGCGLCTQVCPSGALQLYDPAEMLVFISDKYEIKKSLMNQNIPFLAYSLNDYKRSWLFFEESNESNIDFLKKPLAKLNNNEIKSILNTIWEIRVPGEKINTRKSGDQFVLSDGKDDYFKEYRWDRKKLCKECLGKILDVKEDAIIPALWSQLIWSDPGQVLWDSFILIATNDHLFMLRQGHLLFAKEYTAFSWDDVRTEIEKLNGPECQKNIDAFNALCSAIERRAL